MENPTDEPESREGMINDRVNDNSNVTAQEERSSSMKDVRNHVEDKCDTCQDEDVGACVDCTSTYKCPSYRQNSVESINGDTSDIVETCVDIITVSETVEEQHLDKGGTIELSEDGLLVPSYREATITQNLTELRITDTVSLESGKDGNDVPDGLLKFLCGKSKTLDEDKSPYKSKEKYKQFSDVKKEKMDLNGKHQVSNISHREDERRVIQQIDTTEKSQEVPSPDEDIYDFSHTERGYMIIIVNDFFVRQPKRDGAMRDLSNMKEIARKFGFRVLNAYHERNLTLAETKLLIQKAQSMDHSNYDCFAFMISTHGYEERNPRAGNKSDHALICADDRLIFTSDITDMFNDKNCPTLKNKPKFFFIQACRGEKLDRGEDVKVIYRQGIDKPCSAITGPQHPRSRSIDEADTKGRADPWGRNQTVYSEYVTATVSVGSRSMSQFGENSNLRTENQTLTQVHNQPRSPRPGGYNTYDPRNNPMSFPHKFGELGRSYKPSSAYRPVIPYPIVETPSIRCDNDMLVLYAIPPGYFAWRNNMDGSWMIHYLHEILMAYDFRRPRNFLNVLTKVCWRMSERTTNAPGDRNLHEKKAVSVLEHKLIKDVIFKQKVPMSDWVKNLGAF